MEPNQGDSLKTIAQEIERLIDEEESGVLVVVIANAGSAPGKVGAKMLVLMDGRIHGTVGGGVFEARVMADALNALEDGRGPRSLHYNLDELGMSCGGEMTVYVEPMEAPRRVFIFGGGHVGAAVARQMKLLGCVVAVIDEREEWANAERLQGIDEVVNLPFAEYLASSPPGSKDHVIIVTRGHQQDQLVLEQTIGRRPAYIGMIGSRKKARQALTQLREKGVAADLIKTVRTPVGLDIGAVTPDEIAVSIAAELIMLWRKGGLPSDRTPTSGDRPGKKAPTPKARPAVREVGKKKEGVTPPELPKQEGDSEPPGDSSAG